jgi:hypothetical protein
MGTPDVLAHLSRLGVRLMREGDALVAGPRSALTDEARGLIRAHKAELLAALPSDGGDDPLPDPAAEARRQRVLAMLAERPGIRYAVVVDNPEADPVIVALAIRDAMQDGSIVTCELRIPREKWDGVLFLEMLERHTVH